MPTGRKQFFGNKRASVTRTVKRSHNSDLLLPRNTET